MQISYLENRFQNQQFWPLSIFLVKQAIYLKIEKRIFRNYNFYFKTLNTQNIFSILILVN